MKATFCKTASLMAGAALQRGCSAALSGSGNGMMTGQDRNTAVTVVETDVPARLDRLPWARFHWLVLIGLGVAWILDGLEVTLVGSLSGAIAQSPVLHMSPSRVGDSASAYLVGAVIGCARLRLACRLAGAQAAFRGDRVRDKPRRSG